MSGPQEPLYACPLACVCRVQTTESSSKDRTSDDEGGIIKAEDYVEGDTHLLFPLDWAGQTGSW